MRVLVTGATGVIGRQLVPQLVAAGHQVSATTRTAAKLDGLRAAGADLLLLDGLDGGAVGEVVVTAEPDVIVHEMTAIPTSLSLRKFDQSFAATNELRTAGLDHMLAAALIQRDDLGHIPPRGAADLLFVAGDPLQEPAVISFPQAMMQAGVWPRPRPSRHKSDADGPKLDRCHADDIPDHGQETK